MPMTAKQIRFFGTKRQKAALRRKRSSHSSPKRRATTRRSNMPSKKKGGSRRSKTIHVLDVVAKLNALFQGLEPFLSRGIIQAAQAGDFPQVLQVLREGGKEAISVSNLLQAVGPIVGLRIVRKVASMVGAPNPRLGKVALY